MTVPVYSIDVEQDPTSSNWSWTIHQVIQTSHPLNYLKEADAWASAVVAYNKLQPPVVVPPPPTLLGNQLWYLYF